MERSATRSLPPGLRGVVLLDLVLADAHLETLLVHLLHQRRLLDQKAVRHGRHQHKGGLQQEERQVVGALHVGDHDRDGNQHDARAGVAHDLLHGVGLGAQRARRDVSHDGHRHGAVHADGKQRDQDGADKQRQTSRVVCDCDERHRERGYAGAQQDEGGAAAELARAAVRQDAKERQQKEAKDVVDGHDRAGQGVGEPKGAGEHLGHDAVVDLPEADHAHERQRCQGNGAVVEFGRAPCCGVCHVEPFLFDAPPQARRSQG